VNLGRSERADQARLPDAPDRRAVLVMSDEHTRSFGQSEALSSAPSRRDSLLRDGYLEDVPRRGVVVLVLGLPAGRYVPPGSPCVAEQESAAAAAKAKAPNAKNARARAGAAPRADDKDVMARCLLDAQRPKTARRVKAGRRGRIPLGEEARVACGG
jgi:hypothetical protein